MIGGKGFTPTFADPVFTGLYVFTNSLTRFIDLFRGLASQRLMGAHLIVVQQILLQFVPKLC